MHDEIEAVLERALHRRACKGVVGDGEDAALLRDLRHHGEIDELQHRIGRGLDPDETRLRPDRRLDRGAVAEIDVADAKTGRALAHAGEETVCAAIEIVGGEHMRALRQEIEDGGGAGHAGGEGEALRAALEIGDAALIGHARRILRARIFVAFVDAGTLLHVSRGGIDRRHDRARRGIGRLAGVNAARGEAAAVALGAGHESGPGRFN
jgi:hypothetical protein